MYYCKRLIWLEFRPRALGPKPGPRQIAPKKQSLIKQQKMTKVCLPFFGFFFFGGGDGVVVRFIRAGVADAVFLFLL